MKTWTTSACCDVCGSYLPVDFIGEGRYCEKVYLDCDNEGCGTDV